MAEPNGVEAIVGDAIADAKALLASERAQQLDLLAVPDAEAMAEARIIHGDYDTAGAVQRARRRGRPPGATNRRTEDFAKWILGFGGHPAVTLMRIQSMPVEELAKIAHCKPLEALDRQIRCAGELLPYLEGKKPQQVDLRVQGDMALMIGGLGGAAEGATTAELTMIAMETGIIEAEFGDVDDEGQETAENSHSEGGE
ncbi:hypothetical protein [Sphingomonas sp. KC8]|uniref:hypothetical protein n=1 Tax=Sphingomonas sp. KC8 TaxID=1030157 RepID=UPI000248A42A|nr:hypothetical protein [Sphingomonas sp. KC8]ARS27625.1 hypothetical protein KC8_10005 [Sphingomonas sp. KC8]